MYWLSVTATGSAPRMPVIMKIAAASSDRCSLRAWTISFCIHAVALVCTVGLLRHSPAHVQPPPLRLDFLLVEPEAPPASTPGQFTENESFVPELVEPEPLPASMPTHPSVMERPPVTPTPTAQHLDTRPMTAPARQEIAQPMTNAHASALDAPKPVTQSQPVPAAVSEGARPSVSARVDTQSPLIPPHAPQGQTAADTIDLIGPPSAHPSAPPSTLQASSPDQADAEDQLSPPSVQPTAHTADSGVSPAQETPGPIDAPVTTAVVNHPSTSARTFPSRPDYSWLTDALRRRVESLKTYPRLARTQGWEGRVVVRATIKDDGSLLDAQVVESSGYETLDDDAIRLMQRTCPIRLQHEIGRPHVVVMVPIQYRLKP